MSLITMESPAKKEIMQLDEKDGTLGRSLANEPMQVPNEEYENCEKEGPIEGCNEKGYFSTKNVENRELIDTAESALTILEMTDKMNFDLSDPVTDNKQRFLAICLDVGPEAVIESMHITGLPMSLDAIQRLLQSQDQLAKMQFAEDALSRIEEPSTPRFRKFFPQKFAVGDSFEHAKELVRFAQAYLRWLRIKDNTRPKRRAASNVNYKQFEEFLAKEYAFGGNQDDDSSDFSMEDEEGDEAFSSDWSSSEGSDQDVMDIDIE